MMGMLYERCKACGGSGKVHGVNQFGVFVEAECSCRGTGFIETGLTVGQVDRLVKAELARLGDPSARASTVLPGADD